MSTSVTCQAHSGTVEQRDKHVHQVLTRAEIMHIHDEHWQTGSEHYNEIALACAGL